MGLTAYGTSGETYGAVGDIYGQGTVTVAGRWQLNDGASSVDQGSDGASSIDQLLEP